MAPQDCQVRACSHAGMHTPANLDAHGALPSVVCLRRRNEKDRSITVTPFEKNLHVWRQLWRVIERSDVLVQIVDSRNPLLFWYVACCLLGPQAVCTLSDSAQLCGGADQVPRRVRVRQANQPEQGDTAVDQQGRLLERGLAVRAAPLLLLCSDAELPTPCSLCLLLCGSCSRAWAKYFEGIGVNFVFFSAFEEQQKLDEAHRAQYGGGIDLLAQAVAAGDKIDAEEDPRCAWLENTHTGVYHRKPLTKVDGRWCEQAVGPHGGPGRRRRGR